MQKVPIAELIQQLKTAQTMEQLNQVNSSILKALEGKTRSQFSETEWTKLCRIAKITATRRNHLLEQQGITQKSLLPKALLEARRQIGRMQLKKQLAKKARRLNRSNRPH